jgi:hypothetical protein
MQKGSNPNGAKLRGGIVGFLVALGARDAHEVARTSHELIVFRSAFEGAGLGAVGPEREQICGQGQQEFAVAAVDSGRRTQTDGQKPALLSQSGDGAFEPRFRS